MGVDARLIIANKWSIDDVVGVLKFAPGVEHVEAKQTSVFTMLTIEIKCPNSGYKWFNDEDINERSINFHMSYNSPIGPAILLTMRANAHATMLLTHVAKVLGGFLTPQDVTNDCEEIRGTTDEEDGLPYHVKAALISGQMKNERDGKGLINHISNFCGEDYRPKYGL